MTGFFTRPFQHFQALLSGNAIIPHEGMHEKYFFCSWIFHYVFFLEL